MADLAFRPEPFSTSSCGCGGKPSSRSIYAELEEPEWDVEPAKPLPAGVEERASLKAVKPIQCRPGMTKMCPALPEVWRSHKIANIPFFYEPTIKSVPGVADRKQVTARGRAYKVELVPNAWLAASNWIVLMAAFNMPITEILTAGAGRYCRCVRKPTGVCREDKSTWALCTGDTISDHGFGDALDIIGVKWANKALVGSSTDYTVIHSWRDSAEQARILIRINALLRVAFSTVLDYSRADHRDHFHCDMNDRVGRPRKVWGEAPCESNFITSSLRNFGYLAKGQAVTWPNAKRALVRFAAKVGAPLPADQNNQWQWRPLVNRLMTCVALADNTSCRA